MIDIVKTETNTGFEFMNGMYEVLCTIPNNATNGDIIKALFPNVKIKFEEYKGNIHLSRYLVIFDDFYELEFYYDWWNAPWKR